MNRWIKVLLGVIVISMNISCDQITKSIVRSEINPGEMIPVIKNYLTLTNIENTGAFLSLGESWLEPVKMFFLMFLPVIFILFGLYFMVKFSNRNIVLIISIAFVIGGGIGNMIDRFKFKSVTDFLHLDFGIVQTGIFNMADVSIVIGIISLFYCLSQNYFHTEETTS